MKRRKNKPPTKSAVDYIELLYNKYAPKLKYVAKQYIHNDTLAEDVLQNVFEKALLYSEKILELPDEKAFTFLYVIVRNTAYDMIKVESRNNHEELTYEDGEPADSSYPVLLLWIQLSGNSNAITNFGTDCKEALQSSPQFLTCSV